MKTDPASVIFLQNSKFVAHFFIPIKELDVALTRDLENPIALQSVHHPFTRFHKIKQKLEEKKKQSGCCIKS